MTLEEMKQELKAIEANKQRTQNILFQLIGQEVWLRDRIAKEEKIPEKKEEKDERKEEGAAS